MSTHNTTPRTAEVIISFQGSWCVNLYRAKTGPARHIILNQNAEPRTRDMIRRAHTPIRLHTAQLAQALNVCHRSSSRELGRVRYSSSVAMPVLRGRSGSELIST